jgi:hypothetical protein
MGVKLGLSHKDKDMDSRCLRKSPKPNKGNMRWTKITQRDKGAKIKAEGEVVPVLLLKILLA